MATWYVVYFGKYSAFQQQEPGSIPCNANIFEGITFSTNTDSALDPNEGMQINKIKTFPGRWSTMD